MDVNLSALPTLTDDELLALVLIENEGEADVYRPGALPTVDVDDRAAVLAAVFRGQRSLGVRGLASERGGTPELELLGRLLRNVAPALVLYLAGPDLQIRTFAGATIWRPVAGRAWLRQTVSVVGSHGFSTQDSEDLGPDLADVLLRFAHEKQDDAETPLWLCLVVTAGDTTEIRGVRDGQLTSLVRGADGTETRADLALGSVAAEIGGLVRRTVTGP